MQQTDNGDWIGRNPEITTGMRRGVGMSTGTGMSIGTALLMVLFSVLCLTVFAVLSLTSARNDLSLTQRTAERQTVYYAADAEAEEILSELDAILEKAALENRNSSRAHAQWDAAAYIEYVREQLKTYDRADVLLEEPIETTGLAEGDRGETGVFLLSYTVPINEEQALSVVLSVTDPMTEATYYTIREWKCVNTKEWNGDNSLHVLP